MPIRFRCQFCSSKIKAPVGSQGRKTKCPRCGQFQRVPDGSSRRSPQRAMAGSATDAYSAESSHTGGEDQNLLDTLRGADDAFRGLDHADHDAEQSPSHDRQASNATDSNPQHDDRADESSDHLREQEIVVVAKTPPRPAHAATQKPVEDKVAPQDDAPVTSSPSAPGGNAPRKPIEPISLDQGDGDADRRSPQLFDQVDNGPADNSSTWVASAMSKMMDQQPQRSVAAPSKQPVAPLTNQRTRSERAEKISVVQPGPAAPPSSASSHANVKRSHVGLLILSAMLRFSAVISVAVIYVLFKNLSSAPLAGGRLALMVMTAGMTAIFCWGLAVALESLRNVMRSRSGHAPG